MARNVSRTFATMDEDERRRFALEQSRQRPDGEVAPIDFPDDDPRDLPAGEAKREGGDRD